jgi:hypothetical protein
MIDKIAILLPTRNRLEDFKIFAESWKNTTEGLSDVVVRIDNDDLTYEDIKKEYPQFIYEYGERKPPITLLNELAIKYSQIYNYVNFMEDDCNFNTKGWEKIFIDKINELGEYGIVWGNDLINEHKLVGLPFMNSKIVRCLGYMAPPKIEYLWVDYYWLKLGQGLNSLFYFPNVIVEHRHYSTGKREKDLISEIIDVGGRNEMNVWYSFEKKELNNDIEKLKQC